MVAAIVRCPSKACAVEGGDHIVSRRDNIQELSKGKLFRDIFWGDRGMLREAEEAHDFKDSSDETEAEKAGLGDENVGILRAFGRTEECSCKDTSKKGDGYILRGNVVLLRK